MGYYMGDFYRGYRGDPGFFGSLWGGIKRIAGPAVGLLPVPGAGIASRAIATIQKVKESKAYGIAKAVVQKAGQHPVLTAAGGAGVVGVGTAAVMHGRSSSAAAGMAATARGMGVSGGFGGRHKRMNVCNPRALKRAIRRTHGFAKLAMKTIHLVHPTKHARFGGFKRVKHAPRRKHRA